MTEPNIRDARRRVVAALVRKFGSPHLEAILDATQDALVSALVSWPHHGEPLDQTGWLVRTAERRVIDRLRRSSRECPVLETLTSSPAQEDELDLYFLTCSPKLNIREQVCLMLRTLSGLTAAEIARLLHESEEAVQRRISRAKNRLTPDDLSLGNESAKHEAVLLTLYLIFTEGYEASRGDEYIRPELAYLALRLAEELGKMSQKPNGQLEALLALMHFNLSRLPARVDAQGEPILLLDQDRARYDTDHIRQGFFYLSQAQKVPQKGAYLSRYHIEAGLAAAIASSANSAEILSWHQALATHFPTPVNQISLAIAIGEHEGAEKALSALALLAADKRIGKTPHYHGARGHFLAKLGRNQEAREAYQRAIAGSMSNPTRRSFERRIEQVNCHQTSTSAQDRN